MMNSNIIAQVELRFPNELPDKQVTDFELGVLIGQRQVVDDLKVRLKISEEEIPEDEVK